jgi:hypothetical protein
MEIIEQNEYREVLLNWCNDIYLYWENIKPRYSKLFDLKSLDEWEESCRKLMNKLQTDDEVNLEDYHKAISLYEQWEKLDKESNSYQESLESEERNLKTISLLSDNATSETKIANDKIDELNKERIELIKMVLNLEIPMHQIGKFLLDNNV